MTEPIRLDGKVAIVTGAGRGLGRAYAQALADAGAAVLVNDIDTNAANDTANTITTNGGNAIAVAAPVGSAEVADELINTATHTFGQLDAIITNAGILRDAVLWKMTDEAFDDVIHTHLRGTFTCARAAARQFREQGHGGRIIVVGSPAGQHGNFGQTNYAAAKAGIVAFARTWALELQKAAITVNAIIPTAWTEMTASIPIYAPLAQHIAQGQPLPQHIRQAHALGTPADCAPLITWLTSDTSAHVTGQAIGIGGDTLTIYTHPTKAHTQLHTNGWTPETINTAWQNHFTQHTQTNGITLPDLEPS